MIECKNITKRYPGVTALDEVTFALERNRITGILGENGAGKSTLMNIIFGMTRPDAGNMLLGGKDYQPRNSSEAIEQGVGMVHQSQMLIEDFTVAENIILGYEPVISGGIIDFRDAEAKIAGIFTSLGSKIIPHIKVRNLDPFERQEVELAKVLYRNASLIILDEPTSLLAPKQIEQFFIVLKRLKDAGKTILLVTHRIAEVEAMVDDVLILRKGRLAEFRRLADFTRKELVSLIVADDYKTSRHFSDKSSERERKTGKQQNTGKKQVAFELSDVSTSPSLGGRRLEKINLKINAGEIVGITGVPGNGQMELLDLAAGTQNVISGGIFFDGEGIPLEKLKELRKKPVGYIFPDRDSEGLIPHFSIEDNLLLSRRMLSFFSRYGWLDHRHMRDYAERAVEDFSIRNASAGIPVAALSGGNRQKVVLAREILNDVGLVVAGEPSRGLDIKTTEALCERFIRLKDSGAAALIISGDLDFLFSIADRIGVLYKGSINYIKDKASIIMDDLNKAMLGYK